MFSQEAEIISADALQVYKGLDIGTAKPSPSLLQRIPHHLIDILDYTQSFSAGDFCDRTQECIQEIHSRGNLPVLSGGTAFYFKAWLMGLPQTPPSDPLIRQRVEERWIHQDEDAIREALFQVDEVSAQRIGRRDRYRLLRALEVHEQTGKALSSFDVPNTPRQDYPILSLGLRREREELYQRIDQRVDAMMKAGLAHEVAELRAGGARPEHPGMKAIGYQEWFPSEDGREPELEQVQNLIARNSRRYAKRQITFFSSLPDVHWFHPEMEIQGPSGMKETVQKFLNENL
ncbi:MAG: tRNA (adenosine(37)-N6)-dimethylallyltransferase MiaA [Spirochaetales bacterium]|nr:tRNA (adenosine(37)-N6)-dimethylallyltransferase MiaA [Spirochaetales bacterium]